VQQPTDTLTQIFFARFTNSAIFYFQGAGLFYVFNVADSVESNGRMIDGELGTILKEVIVASLSYYTRTTGATEKNTKILRNDSLYPAEIRAKRLPNRGRENSLEQPHLCHLCVMSLSVTIYLSKTYTE
jgi:hypothetical protein